MSRIKTPDYTFSPGVSTVQGSGDDTQSQIWIGTFNATTDFSASLQTILDIGDDPSTTSLFSWFFIGLMGGDLAYANTVVGNSGSNRRSFANDLNTNTDYTYVIEMDATDQVRRAYLFEASDPSLVFQSDMRNALSSQSRSPRTGLIDGVTIAYEVLVGDVYVELGNGVVPGEFLGGSTTLKVHRETTLPDN